MGTEAPVLRAARVGRFTTFGAALGLAAGLLLGACDASNKACVTCPAIEGSYALVFEEVSATNCQGITPVANGTLQVTRTGSRVRGSFPPWEDLLGTLYDSGDWTLSGVATGANSDTLSIRGTLQPARDGGVPGVFGTWVEAHPRSTPTGTQDCSLTRDFIGTRK